MEQRSFKLSANLDARLERMAEKLDRDVSWCIRKAIEHWLWTDPQVVRPDPLPLNPTPKRDKHMDRQTRLNKAKGL